MNVEGRTAVVTGAAGGIGAAIAARLLTAGARVLLTDLDEQRLDAQVAELARAHSGEVRGLAGDAASETHIAACLDAALAAFGPVDVYVANAGVGLGAGLDADEAVWTTALEVNLLAHVRAARLLVPGWLERGGGYFVATASAAGLLTQIGSPTYTASKHAAVGFAEWLAVTYGDRGVRVSCLCPMGVETDLLHSGERSGDPLSTRAVTTAGAVLQPVDVADALLAAMDEERFLVLPHPEVLEMYRRKGADYDRWIAGMQRYRAGLERSLDDAGPS